MDKLKAKLNQVEAIIHADDFYTKYSADERLETLEKYFTQTPIPSDVIDESSVEKTDK